MLQQRLIAEKPQHVLLFLLEDRLQFVQVTCGDVDVRLVGVNRGYRALVVGGLPICSRD